MERNGGEMRTGMGKDKLRVRWRQLQQARGPVLVGVVALVGVSIVFPLVYAHDLRKWNEKWEGECEDWGQRLENGFGKSFVMFDVLAKTIERFYAWPDVPQLEQKGFQDYMSSITPGTFIANFAFSRYLMSEEARRAYETKRKRKLVGVGTGLPPSPQRLYRVCELIQNPLGERTVGFEVTSIAGSVIPTNDLIKAIETGNLFVSPPLLTSEAFPNMASQYFFVASQVLYKKKLSVNATVAERLDAIAGGLSVNFDITSIINTVAKSFKESASSRPLKKLRFRAMMGSVASQQCCGDLGL